VADEKMEHNCEAMVRGGLDNIDFKMFNTRLKDIRAKYLALKSTFETVVNGIDDFEIRQARLDSIFIICNEIYLFICEDESMFYMHANVCVDLISCFLVMHLGMLNMAVEGFNLNDYK
jgi:hypothetical protein